MDEGTIARPASLPRVLCVDDDQHVLDGLTLHLRRRYDLITATSGLAALARLAEPTPTAVIVSDMRMPGMDGAAFLQRSCQVAPEATRILLTGQSDLSSAIRVINDGQIFRFLTKPCPTQTLIQAIEAGVAQHRLLTSEKVLLEQTLHGTIAALTEILSLTNPVSFGRAQRIRQLVTELATTMAFEPRWQVEVAAMFSQLGWISVPDAVAERAAQRVPLTAEEQGMIDRIPAVTEQLLNRIPRLDSVRGMLNALSPAARPVTRAVSDPQQASIARGAAILRTAIDFDALDAEKESATVAIAHLRGKVERYGTDVLDALTCLRADATERKRILELALANVQAEMVFAEDVRLATGALLAPKAFRVTISFVERARNYPVGMVKEPVLVYAP